MSRRTWICLPKTSLIIARRCARLEDAPNAKPFLEKSFHRREGTTYPSNGGDGRSYWGAGNGRASGGAVA